MSKNKLIGLESLKKRFYDHVDKVKKDVDILLEVHGRKIHLKATQRVDKNLGKLAQSIFFEIREHTASVSVNSEVGFYREFGTGTKLKVPSGWESVAAEGKNLRKGSWSEFIENIEDWCRDKGIDKKAAYPIALKIYRVGSKGNPFLIPSYEEEWPKFLKALKKYANEVRW